MSGGLIWSISAANMSSSSGVARAEGGHKLLIQICNNGHINDVHLVFRGWDIHTYIHNYMYTNVRTYIISTYVGVHLQ